MNNHEKIIYMIETNFLSHSNINLVDLKIGETNNIDRRLTSIKTSSSYDVKIIQLWKKSNTPIKSCESGIHMLAEEYCLRRKRENFIIFKDKLDDLVQHIGLLLIPVDRKELMEVAVEKIDTEVYAFKKPKSFTLLDSTIKVNTWKDVYMSFLKIVFTKLDVSKIIDLKGRKKPWFSTDDSVFIRPKKILHTEYYVETKMSAHNIVKSIRKIMKILDIKEQDFSVEKIDRGGFK